jgi:hypothetical protein
MADEPPSASRAILPADADRQLTLPADLIQRGLALAERLQLKQGIQPSQKPAPAEFLVRCNPIEFKVVNEAVLKGDPIKNYTVFGERIDLFVAIRPEGMTISKIGPEQRLDYTPVWNEASFVWLKSLDAGELPQICILDYEIFYYLYQEQGKFTIEGVQSKNVKVTGPIKQGDPSDMKAIAIFFYRDGLAAGLALAAMDRRGLEDREALLALVATIKQIKKLAA